MHPALRAPVRRGRYSLTRQGEGEPRRRRAKLHWTTRSTAASSSAASRSCASFRPPSTPRCPARARWRWSSASPASARRPSASSSPPTSPCAAAKRSPAIATRRARCRCPTCAFVEALRSYVHRPPARGAARRARLCRLRRGPHRQRGARATQRRAASARRPRGGPLAAAAGGLRLPAQRLRRPAAAARAGGPALGRPGTLDLLQHLARNLAGRTTAGDRHLPRRRGRPLPIRCRRRWPSCGVGPSSAGCCCAVWARPRCSGCCWRSRAPTTAVL